MNTITDKLNLLIDLIEKREPEEVNTLQPGLTREEIQQKTASLPFDFPEELYELYKWRNGVREDEMIGCNPLMIFRDHYLSNLDDAIDNYRLFKDIFDDEDKRIADWNKCFPFADLDGSYYLFVCGNHILIDKYKSPIIEVFEAISLIFYSFDSMLNTCIEWSQQSPEQYKYEYGMPENQYEIWEKNNPGIFNIDFNRM